jgi:hypothetical protein
MAMRDYGIPKQGSTCPKKGENVGGVLLLLLPARKEKNSPQKLFSPLGSQSLLTILGLFLIVALVLIAKQH